VIRLESVKRYGIGRGTLTWWKIHCSDKVMRWGVEGRVTQWRYPKNTALSTGLCPLSSSSCSWHFRTWKSQNDQTCSCNIDTLTLHNTQTTNLRGFDLYTISFTMWNQKVTSDIIILSTFKHIKKAKSSSSQETCFCMPCGVSLYLRIFIMIASTSKAYQT